MLLYFNHPALLLCSTSSSISPPLWIIYLRYKKYSLLVKLILNGLQESTWEKQVNASPCRQGTSPFEIDSFHGLDWVLQILMSIPWHVIQNFKWWETLYILRSKKQNLKPRNSLSPFQVKLRGFCSLPLRYVHVCIFVNFLVSFLFLQRSQYQPHNTRTSGHWLSVKYLGRH